MRQFIQRNRLFALIVVLMTTVVVGCSDEPEESGQNATIGEPDADVESDSGEPDSGEPDADVPDADMPDIDETPAPGEWQLPDGYFMPAKMEMALVHPRVEDATDWAYSKNAHPGVGWEIPVVIQGGAWPFHYEIVDDGGAQGLEIGGELLREEVDGFVEHRVTEEYGVLSWEDPVEGEYDIMVKVNDQDGSSVDVPISLTVGEDGWIFVDADAGDDETGDGSINAPFETLAPISDAPESYDFPRIYLSGVVSAVRTAGYETGDGNESMSLRATDDNTAPRVWVGYPGRDAVLEFNEGGRKFVLSAPDFYMANLELRHHEGFYQEGSYLHMFTAYDGVDRLTFHDIHFSRFQGEGVNRFLGNSSIIMLTADGPHADVAVVNNRISGENGIFTSAYLLDHAVFEKNIASGAQFVTGDNSTWAIFYMKSRNDFVTLRANKFMPDNVWKPSQGPGNLCGGLGLDIAWNIEFAYNTIYTPFVKANSWRGGAITLFTESPHPDYEWTEDTPVWLYRNSLRQRMIFSGGNKSHMPDETVITQKNILQGDPEDYGTWPEHARVVNDDNLDEETFFDDEMRLTGAARDEYLGSYGAEIAVPVDL